jgi:PPM family protein phosphatase
VSARRLPFDAAAISVAPAEGHPTWAVHATDVPPIFAIADAAGGRAAERRAPTAVLEALFATTTPWTADVDGLTRALRNAFSAANAAIYDDELPARAAETMATSLAAVALAAGSAIVAHAGNVRCHHLRRGEAELLTPPHVASLGVSGRAYDCDDDSPLATHLRHLTRACGLSAELEAETSVHRVEPGDVLLLTTDSFRWAATHEAVCGLALSEVDATNLSIGSEDLARAQGVPGAALAIRIGSAGAPRARFTVRSSMTPAPPGGALDE